MARAEQVRADVFTAPQQVAGGFLLLRRDVDGCQRASGTQHRELRRIPPIRLDPVARPPRNQRWRNDLTQDALPDQGPLQRPHWPMAMRTTRRAPMPMAPTTMFNT